MCTIKSLIVKYPYHSIDSVMDMRISLKASQYMMFRRTKVQGKTILDTRSWKSTTSYDDEDENDDDDDHEDCDDDANCGKVGHAYAYAQNANHPFSSFYNFFSVQWWWHSIKMMMLTMQIARSLLLFMISFVSMFPPSFAFPCSKSSRVREEQSES